MRNSSSIMVIAKTVVFAALLFTVMPSSTVADVRINAEDYPGTFEQSGTSMAVYGSGDYVVTWTDQRSGTPIAYVQRFTSSGSPIGENEMVDPGPVAAYGNVWVSVPVVAANGSGLTAIVAPTDRADMVQHVALWLFDSDGTFLAGPIQVSDNLSGGGDLRPYSASVAINDAGQIFIAWYENLQRDLFARWFDATGAPTSDIIKLTGLGADGHSVAASKLESVDLNESGRAFVAAGGYIDGISSNYVVLLDHGSADFARVAVDQQTSIAPDSLYSIYGPAIAGLADGGFAAVWSRSWALGGDGMQTMIGSENIFRKFDSQGTPVGSETPVFSFKNGTERWIYGGDLEAVGNDFIYAGFSYGTEETSIQRIASDGSLSGSAVTLSLGSDSPSAKGLCLADRGDGSMILCWSANGEDGRGNVLVREFATADYTPVTEPRRVHDDLGSVQTEPHLALGTFNTMLTVWIDDRTSIRQSVWGRFTTINGDPIGEPFQISQQTGYWISDLAVGGNGTGQAVVAWTAWKNDNYVPNKVYCQILEAPSFAPIGNNIIVSDAAYNSSDFKPAVAVAPDNSFVVAYRGTTEASTFATNRPYNVYLQRYSATGSPLTATVAISTEGAETVYENVYGTMAPSIAMKSDGSFVVAWGEYLSSATLPRSYPVLRRFAADATPISDVMQGCSSGYASSNRPYVAVNGSDQYAIGYTGANAQSSSINYNGPWIQALTGDGTFLSSYIKMNIGDQDAAPSPAVVATGPDGNFVVVYQVPKAGTASWTFTDFDIWACRFTPTGSLLGARRIINSDATTTDQLSPSVITTGDGVVIAWEDNRNLPGNTDIYARYVAWDDLTAAFGDINLSGSTDIGDLTFLIDWFFRGGSTPIEMGPADINGDGAYNIGDVTTLVDYLF